MMDPRRPQCLKTELFLPGRPPSFEFELLAPTPHETGVTMTITRIAAQRRSSAH